MKTLKFTDPNGNYPGFKKVDVLVDLNSLTEDNCTVYEVVSEDRDFSVEIGLNILAPSVTTLTNLKAMAYNLGLKLEVVEGNISLEERSVILSNFTAQEDGGTDGEVPSTGIILTFEKSVLGLTSQNITLVGTTLTNVAVVAGTNNKQWLLGITDTSVPNKENIEIKVGRWKVNGIEYGALGNAVASVYNVLPEEITFTAQQQGGSNGVSTTTGVLLNFSKTVSGLVIGDIVVTGATKGVLTANEDGTFLLTISSITVANGGNVTVDVENWVENGTEYTVTNSSPVSVSVYKVGV